MKWTGCLPSGGMSQPQTHHQPPDLAQVNSCETQKNKLRSNCMSNNITRNTHVRIPISKIVVIKDYPFTGYQYPYGYYALLSYSLSFE